MGTSTEDILRKELTGLVKYMDRVKQEIASINNPGEDHKFTAMADQLDAIIGATEKATNTIMETIEKNEEILGKVREGLEDAGKLELLDQVTANNMDVFEACSFQDITGQRVNKVLKSMRYVEDRIGTLIEVWGRNAIESVEVKHKEKVGEEALLNGPQLDGEGLQQNDVDKVFSQDDIDALFD